jgi:hypothetical protein
MTHEKQDDAPSTEASVEDIIAAARAGEKSSPAKKMQIEWFNDAAQSALTDSNEPLIEDLLDDGAFSVFYGDSNSGKTFVCLDMSFHVSTGVAWQGRAVKRGLVIYLAAEGGKRIRRRLAALKKHYADAPDPMFALIRYPIDLRSSDADLQQLLRLINDVEAQTKEKCAWIVIDTLSRAMAGGNENSPEDMGAIVMSADKIRAATGAHFSYVHHCGKNAALGARGHSLLRAATDSEIEVANGAITVEKQRDMECGFHLGFRLVDVPLGEDQDGREIKSAICEWQGAACKVVKMSKRSIEMQRLHAAFVATYERLADAVEKTPGLDGKPVRKVATKEIRDAMADRGFLNLDDDGKLDSTERGKYRKAKGDLIADGLIVESAGMIWKIRDF